MSPKPVILSASCAILLARVVVAQDTFTWSGVGPDGNWSTNLNWNAAAVPNGNDFLRFDGVTNLVTTNDLTGGALNQFQIFFETGAGAYTLNGTGLNLFDFGGAHPKVENSSSNLQTINLPLTLNATGAGGNIAEINPVNGNLVLNGTTDLAGTTKLFIYGDNGNSVTFNGAITSTGSGGGNLVSIKQNSTVVFNAVNTYTGNTEIDAGVLEIGATGGLDPASQVFVGNGGTPGVAASLLLTGPNGGQALGNTITINPGSGSNRIIGGTNTSGTSTFSGPVKLDGAVGENRGVSLTAEAGGTVQFTGVISGAGQSVTKVGSGTVVLSGANTFGGGITIQGGSLRVGGDANLGDVAGGIVLDGGGLVASGTFETARPVVVTEAFGNAINVASGQTLTINSAITGAGGVAKDGTTTAFSGTLVLGGAAANTYVGATTVGVGALNLAKTGGAQAIGGDLLIDSSVDTGSGNTGSATVMLIGAGEQIADNANVAILNTRVSERAELNLNGFTETVGGVEMRTTSNSGAILRTGAGGTLKLNGDLILSNERGATGNTGREVLITATGSVSTAAAGGGFLDLNGTRTIFVGTNPGNTQTSTDATIETEIINGSIVKTGSRVLRLGAVNTYAGSTTINEGTLRVLVDGALPVNTPLTVSAVTPGTTATLDLNGFNYTLTSANNLMLGGGAGASNIATGAGMLTLAADVTFDATNDPATSVISGKLDIGGNRLFNVGDSLNAAADLAISAAISGTGDITKTGAGALALRAQNTAWSGNILVNQGVLRLDTGLANNTELNNVFGAAGNGITLNGTTLQVAYHGTGNVDRLVTGRVITVGAGGATIDTAGAYNNFSEGVLSQIRFNGTGQNTILSGSGTLTKNGGGRLQFQTASPDFSGAVVINDGTMEASGAALGNGAPENTITINGGNWAVTGDSNQPQVTLSGGAMSTNGASRTVNGAVAVTGSSRVFLNNFWTDASSGWNMTLTGVVSGGADLLVGVNRPGYDNNSGSLILKNTGNTYSGNITVEKNLGLTSDAAGNVGSALGTASVTLAGGKLNLRDNGTDNNGVLNYGNNVAVVDTAGGGDIAGTATIDINRSNGTNAGNTFRLGTLSIGGQTLNVSGGNGYNVEFAGLTTFTGSPTLNVTTANLTLAGGLSAAGQQFTKTGAGTLRILGTAVYDGFTLTAGTLELPSAPAGTARDIAVPAGTGFGAGYAATQANLIDRITFDSAGVVALGVDSNFNPDFTGFTGGLRLGGTANAALTGVITPADGTVRLGGGGGTLTLASQNAIAGAVNLDVNTNGTAPGTIALAAANSFTGTVAVGGGMTLRAGSNASLGNGNAAINLDGGILRLANGGDFAGFSTRTLAAGAGGATLDTDGNDVALNTAIQGTGVFIKTGAGTLTLSSANSTFAGKTIIRGGIISIGSADHFGATPSSTVADQLRFEGGTLLATADLTIPAARGITLGAGGGTIDTGSNTITASSIVAGGNPLIKEGSGTLILSVDNSYNGPTTINAGTLQVSNNVDSNVTVNAGGTLRTTGGNSISDGLTVTVNPGGTYDIRSSDTIGRLVGGGLVSRGTSGTTTLTLNSGTAANFDGVIENGVGTLAITKAGANTVTFTGTNTYTGNTAINQGQLRVEGANARLSAGGVVNVGDNNGNDESLILGSNDDVVIGVLDRFGDTAQLEFRGSTAVTINGPAAGAVSTTEIMGQLDFREGTGVLTLMPAAGGQIELNASALIRENNNGSGVIRGLNLGGTGADSSRVLFSTAPTVVGSGGAGTQASIIPFVIGGSSAFSAPDTFVRYDAVNGVVPLGSADYKTSIAGSTGSNVSIAADETINSNVAINALRVTAGTATITAGTRVDVRSGALLFTGTGNIDGAGTVNFGRQQGVIHASGDGSSITAAVNANLTGSSGLIIGDAGDAPHTIALGGDNRIIGGVTVNNGILRAESAGALNNQIFNDLILRAGNSGTTGAAATAFQLGGNSLSVVFGGSDRLQGSTRIQNASDTPATLTIITNVTSDGNDGALQDGTGAGALSLIKRGSAQLTIEQNNSYTGTTEIAAGTLRLRGGSGVLSGTSEINIRGGTLTVRGEGSGNVNGNRLPDAAPISTHGGTFNFEHTADSGQSYSENAGPLRILAGGTGLNASQAASGRTSNVVFDSIERPNMGAIITFNGTGLGTSASRNRISFDNDGPVLNDGIIGGWAFYNGADFASYSLDVDAAAANNQGSIVPATYDSNTTNAAQNAWTAASNIRPTESIVLAGSGRTVNSVNLIEGVNLDIGGFTLNVDTGGVIAAGATAKTISNGSLTAGAAANTDIVVRTEGATSNANISAVITDNAVGAVGLTKTGTGRLTLSGVNTYTGKTAVLLGTLAITDDAQLGAVPASATAGHLQLFGGTLEIGSSIALNPNRGIEVGGSGGTIDVRGSNVFTYSGAITGNGAAPITFTGERVVTGNTVAMPDANVALSAPINIDGDFNFNLDGSVSLSGAVNRIGSGFQVGAQQSDATFTYNVAGGSLAIGGINPNGNDLNIGVRTIDSGSTTTITRGMMDLMGSKDLTVRANNINIGVNLTSSGGSSQAEGDLIIGENSDIMAANQILIGDSIGSGNTTASPSSIVFGTGTNDVTSPLMVVGGRKGNGSATIAAGGTLTLSGFGSGSGDLYIGRQNVQTGTVASGNFDASSGTLIADLDEIVVAHKSGTGGTGGGGVNGTFTIGSGANVISANSIVIGDRTGTDTGNVNGTMSFGGGSLKVAGNVSLGLANGTSSTSNAASGTLNIQGGSVAIDGDVVLATRGTQGTANGTLNITGGTTTVGGDITTSDSASANAAITLDGGTLDVTGGTINVDTFNAHSGALHNVAEIKSGDELTPAALVKTTEGTLTLGGVNSYTAATNVNAGTLLVAGSLSGTVAVDVATGATFGGTGTINPAALVTIASGATLAPGLTAGVLNTGSVAFDGGILALDITSPALFDQLSVTGSVSLNAPVELQLTVSSLFAEGTAFTVIQNDGGDALALNNASLFFFGGVALNQGDMFTVNGGFGSQTFRIDYIGGSGNDLVITAVPEPGSAAVLLGATGALLGLGRFRRRSR